MKRLVTFRVVDKALRANGFVLDRTCGSHHLYKKIGHPFSVCVPFHGKNETFKPGTLKSIENQSGLCFTA